MLSAQGRLRVEREQSGVYRDYRRQEQIVLVFGDGNQVAVGHGQTVTQRGSFEKEEALKLLTRPNRGWLRRACRTRFASRSRAISRPSGPS